jgi:hypothetical protein
MHSAALIRHYCIVGASAPAHLRLLAYTPSKCGVALASAGFARSANRRVLSYVGLCSCQVIRLSPIYTVSGCMRSPITPGGRGLGACGDSCTCGSTWGWQATVGLTPFPPWSPSSFEVTSHFGPVPYQRPLWPPCAGPKAKRPGARYGFSLEQGWGWGVLPPLLTVNWNCLLGC